MTERAWSGRRMGSAACWQERTPTPDCSTGAHAVAPPVSVFTAPRESVRWLHGADHWLPQKIIPQRSLCSPRARRLGPGRVAPERIRTGVRLESWKPREDGIMTQARERPNARRQSGQQMRGPPPPTPASSGLRIDCLLPVLIHARWRRQKKTRNSLLRRISLHSTGRGDPFSLWKGQRGHWPTVQMKNSRTIWDPLSRAPEYATRPRQAGSTQSGHEAAARPIQLRVGDSLWVGAAAQCFHRENLGTPRRADRASVSAPASLQGLRPVLSWKFVWCDERCGASDWLTSVTVWSLRRTYADGPRTFVPVTTMQVHCCANEGQNIPDLQNMAAAERREAEPTTQRWKKIRLAVRQETIELLLIPEFCPGGQRLTCGPTLSTNQMRPWEWLGAPDCFAYMCPYSLKINISSSFFLARRQQKISRSRVGSLHRAKKIG